MGLRMPPSYVVVCRGAGLPKSDPGVYGDDVGGEEVDLVEGVVALFQVVGHELAADSLRAGAGGCGFDLHSEKVRAVFNANVIGLHVSPGLADGGGGGLAGLCHELQLDPIRRAV